MTLLRDMAIAESALREGDAVHAAHHAAAVLAVDPQHGRARAIVDHLLAGGAPPTTMLGRLAKKLGAGRQGRALFPADGWYGHVAIHARDDWRAGRLDEALGVLCQVQMQMQHVDYHPWLAAILDDAEERGQQLSPRGLFTAFGQLAAPFVGLLHLRDGERAFFSPWATHATRLLAMHTGGELHGTTALVTSGFLRRAGRYDDALAATDGAPRNENLAVQRALALRALGRFDEAAALFAATHEESGDALYAVEHARVRYDQGRWADALALFEQHGDEADDEILLARACCMAALGDHDVVRAIFGDAPPTYDELRRFVAGDGSRVAMSDAATNALAQLLADRADASAADVRMRTSHRECPSVLMTVALALQGAADADPSATYAFDEDVAYDPAPLWRREGSRFVQALPPPSAHVCAVVTSLAHPTAMSVLVREARAAAVDDVPPEQLLAALVWPPPAPPRTAPDLHVFRWQRAIALLLASQRRHEPWLASVRRQSLRALVLGTSDWTTAAGLLALTQVLLDEPDALADVRVWLDELRGRAVSIAGHCPWATALAHLDARVPGLRPDLLAPLSTWLADDGA